jgi:6-phosphogluconolactonase
MTTELQFGMHKVLVFDSAESISTAAAEFISNKIKKVLQQQKRFFLSLSGGSTPAILYKLLADNYGDVISWQQLEIFFGDERFVPHDHKDSNYRMAFETLLGNVSVPPEQIHGIPTDCDDIHDCVRRYSETLAILPQVHDTPCFDLVLLGMGDDGHTASLFPGTDILSEQQNPVGCVYVEKFNSWRISLTYPVLNVAKQLLVMVTGENKAIVFNEIMTGESTNYPVAKISNQQEMLWFVDSAAASRLSR